jgi:hypothetical protein
MFGIIWDWIVYFHGVFFDFVEFSLRHLDNANHLYVKESPSVECDIDKKEE